MSGSGVYSSDSRVRSVVVVGKRRAAIISKERRAGQIAGDGGGVPAGARREQRVHLGEVRDDVLAQADVVKAVEVLLAGMLFKLRHAAAHQLRPHGVLVRGIPAPVLLDEVGRSKRKAGSRSGGGHGKVPLLAKNRTSIRCQQWGTRTLRAPKQSPEANQGASQSGSADVNAGSGQATCHSIPRLR